MTANETPRRCRACKQGDLLPITWHRTFSPLGEPVTVELLSSKCSHCGAESTSSRQHDENLARLAARKPAYGHLLMGEEIVAFRMKYGLTQRVAAKIFGKGLIAFSRYENEASYPDLSTTKLLKQAMARPELLKALADEEGVAIPLWEARCENERREKRVDLRVIQREAVPGPDWEALRTPHVRPQHRWAAKGVPAQKKSAVLQVFTPAENDESYAEAS